MLITRFNRFFDRHGRWAFAVIGVAIIIPFVFFLTPGAKSRAGRRVSGSSDVGEMYGRPIDRDAFDDAMHGADIAIFLLSGRFPSQNPQWIGFLVEETFRRMRALREAQQRGLDHVSDEQVLETIRSQPRFQDPETEEFGPEIFARFKDFALQQRGLDGEAFDRIIRQNIAIERLEAEVVAGVFVSPQEVRAEFDRQEEEFTISYCDFSLSDFLKDSDVSASDEEVQAYYAEHRTELRLPDRRRIRAACFSTPAFAPSVEISEVEMREHYDKVKKQLYEPKNKSFEDVKDEIANTLRRKKARPAFRAAGEFRKELIERRKAEPDGVPGELFELLCKEKGVAFKDSGPFTDADEGGDVPDIGAYAQLRARGYTVTEQQPYSLQIYDESGHYFIACWLETVPGDVPEELTESVRKDVEERVVRGKAEQYYRDHVETYRDRLTDGKTPQDLKADYAAELAKSTTAGEQTATQDDADDADDADKAGETDEEEISEDERKALREKFNKDVDTYLVPYFLPLQRKARVAKFAFAAFKSAASAQVSKEDVEAYYEANKAAKYSDEEVRVRQILIRAPANAADEAKTKARERAEDVLAQLRQGSEFAELAKAAVSDDTAATRRKGGDLGYFARGSGKPKALENAAFLLEQGEISSIIETRQGYHIIKLEDKRQGRSLAAAAVEIRRQLVDEEAERLAEDAALSFADEAYEALGAAGRSAVAADVFKSVAADKKVSWEDTAQWFRERGAIQPFGWQPTLREEAYALDQDNALSEVIKEKDAFFVACWLADKAACLPAFDDDPALSRRVQRQMQRERALDTARERAAAAYDEIAKKLVDQAAFADAIGDLEFEEAAGFTRQRPPSGVSNAREIAELVSANAAETLLAPVETPTGAVLVYLETRVPPSDEIFEEKQEQYANRLKQRKQRTLLGSFYERLKEESRTELAEQAGPDS